MLDEDYLHVVTVHPIDCELVFLELTKADAAFVYFATHENELDFDAIVSSFDTSDSGQSLSRDVRIRGLSEERA